ncbi:Lymphocyte function-associated antigen 3 [Channa argus]|uniref:Lymphocyte function-associated antigen 3 n=1 Tax=Channa argus TaxID=215402 RepID=A0A6G1QZF1_CHAAH|nr:Lymphocyte function-associated antigen 3 [Channa argus]
MEALAGSFFRTALLLVLFTSAGAENMDTYVAVGGSLELLPPKATPEGLTSILWKHNGNLVAEWVDTLVPTKYYGRFEHRTKLDIVNGHLEISKMTKDDAGLYIVEINNRVQSGGYSTSVLNKVPKPEVVLRTLTCNPASENCSLTCEGDVSGAGVVTYSWKEDDGDWMTLEKSFTAEARKVRSVKTVSCQMKNRVSEDESVPFKNPLFQEEKPISVGGWVAAVIILLALVILGVLVYYFKGDEIRKCFEKPQPAGAAGQRLKLDGANTATHG